MKRTVKFVVAGALAGLALVGCKDTRTYDREGVGGSGDIDLTGEQKAGDDQNINEIEEPGTGGSPRVGDGKIGNNNGVIDDGEGPLERDGHVDDKMGENPGVWNDGEGPVENTDLDRPEAQ